jgi:GNAT superfamily N-acetyltransferase
VTIQGAVVLRDGGLAVIREVTADDHDALLALHEALSPRTLYLRFFSASLLSSARYVNRLVRPEHAEHGGLVLLVEDRLVGVAAYECIPDSAASTPGCAEAAFVVADDQHGRGIGTLLLEHLAALARQRGIHQFIAETLPDNIEMLHVFRDAGFGVTFRRSVDVVDVTIDLTPVGKERVLDAR